MKAAALRSAASCERRASRLASMKRGQRATDCSCRCSQRSQAMCRPRSRPWPPWGPNHCCIKGWSLGREYETKTSGLAFMQAPKMAVRPIRASCSSISSTSRLLAVDTSSSSFSACFSCPGPFAALRASSRWKDFRTSDKARSQTPWTCAGWRQPAPAFLTTQAMPLAIGARSSGSSAFTRSAPTLSTKRCTSSTTMSWASRPRMGTVLEMASTRSAQQGYTASRTLEATLSTESAQPKILAKASAVGRTKSKKAGPVSLMKTLRRLTTASISMI
mmetsp:Transcript_100706/g.324982  ORF Transcript_100706/g.324982 Transcript_100706/m.324982 type:complete len:275 (+) Transcript_100706:716-1540(+)